MVRRSVPTPISKPRTSRRRCGAQPTRCVNVCCRCAPPR